MIYRPLRNSIELSGDAAQVFRAKPPADLAPYVLEFWEYVINPIADAVPTQIFPNGCMSLRFNIRPDHVESILYGPSTSPNMKGWLYSEWRIVGAVLHPERAYQLLGLSAHEFRDLRIKMDSIWPNKLASVESQLAEATNFKQSVAIMSQFLRQRLRTDVLPKSTFLNAYQKIIMHSANSTNIPELTKHYGLSDRHLRRQFKKYLGISPKEMSRVARLQNSIRRLGTLTQLKIIDLSFETGHSEQSHFTREFHSLTGMTPGKFKRLVGRFSEQDLDIWQILSPNLYRETLSPKYFKFR